MNRNGWGLPEMIILSTVILIALFVATLNAKRLSKEINHPQTTVKKEIVNTNKVNKEGHNNTSSEDNNKNSSNTNSLNDNENIDESVYTNIENKMVNSSIEYIKNKYSTVNKVNIIVNYQQLLELDKTLNEEMSKYNCKGYVKVHFDEINDYYTPYLKCNNYMTSGYDSNNE